MERVLLLWHGSERPHDRFDRASGSDGALHLGSRSQAGMRNGAFLHEVEVSVGRLRRCRDRGGDWGERVRRARADGVDAIVYLNRYEGISSATIERLALTGRLTGLDALSDAEFVRLVPEASDSYLILHPERSKILRVIPRGGAALGAEGPDPPLPP